MSSLTQLPAPPLEAGRPDQEIFRHKRLGVWRSWSRAAIARDVERLTETMQTWAIGRHSLVVVSGAYAPPLVLMALAAARLGAETAALPPNIGAAELGRRLAQRRADLVFFGERHSWAQWRAAGQTPGEQQPAVIGFDLPWGHLTAPGLYRIDGLLGETEPAGKQAVAAADTLWIEEATDWPEGLAIILDAVAQGRTVAFPESRLAADRDRAQIQPTDFALSSSHHAGLIGALSARLATGTTLAAKLTRAALAARRAGHASWHHRLLLAQVRRPLGLSRLRNVTIASAGTDFSDTDNLLAALGIGAGHVTIAPRLTERTAEPRRALA